MTGQQGSGAILSGSGGGTVTSVTAGDASIVIGGTATAPTVETGTLDQVANLHPPAADWSNNSHKITSLANGSAAQDAAAFGQTLAGGDGAPLTTKGDLLYENATPAPARLAIGTAGQALTVTTGGIPGWAGGVTGWINANTVYGMSPGASASANVTALQNAFNAAVSAGGGMVYVGTPGTYSLNSTVSKDIVGLLVGLWLDPGVILSYTGTGDCLYLFSSSSPGSSNLDIGSGIYGAGVIDGTSSTAPATGLHFGDIFQAEIRLSVQNFSGSGDIGFHFDNQHYWTEQLFGHIRAQNCTSHVVFDVSGTPAVTATGSFERANLFVSIDQGAASQDGVVFQNGTYLVDGPGLSIFGNCVTSVAVPTSAILRITGTAGVGRPDAGANSEITNCRLDIGVECDVTTGTHGPATILMGSSGNNITDCYGLMDFSASAADFQTSNATGSNFFFQGRINGDSVLAALTQYLQSPFETDGGLLRVVQAGAVGVGGPAQIIMAGAGDGNQFSNFTLADNNSSNTWTASMREPSNNLLFFSFNGSSFVSALQLSQAGVVSILSNTLDLAAGTTSFPPLLLASGTNLTSPAAGAVEYDGASTYATNETTSGRGLVSVEQKFRLTATGGTISTIANYFGTTSNISLVSGAEYEIEIDCWFLKTTAGTVTWTFTNSAAPTAMNIECKMSPATGLVTGTPTATALFSDQYDLTTTAPTVVSPSLTSAVNHHHRFWIRLINGTGTSLKIQATTSAGTITPGINSAWTARRVPAANVGTFAA